MVYIEASTRKRGARGNTTGGKGSGRKPLDDEEPRKYTHVLSVRLDDKQFAVWHRLGGLQFLREYLDAQPLDAENVVNEKDASNSTGENR